MPSQANTTTPSQQPAHTDSGLDELGMDMQASARHIRGSSHVLSICQTGSTRKRSNGICVQTDCAMDVHVTRV